MNGNSYGNGRPNNGYGNRYPQRNQPVEPVRRAAEIDEKNFVDTAEKVMQDMKNFKQELTTSKIRNILSMVNDLYDDVRLDHSKVLTAEMQSRIQYLRLHLAYESGRDKAVKQLTDKADLMNFLKTIKDSRERLLLFCHYMEALVAYHKFYDGKD